MPDLVIIGAGGFGREVHDVLIAAQASGMYADLKFLGFLDDGDPDIVRIVNRGTEMLGGSALLSSLAGAHYVIGVGDPKIRERIANSADDSNLIAQTLIHPNATFGHGVEIGQGSVICSHASITTNISIGKHTHVNLNSTIGHDVRIGNFVSVSPMVAISGGVTIGDNVMLGTQCVILPNREVGSGATVGAGSVVTKDVEPGMTVVGVPARP